MPPAGPEPGRCITSPYDQANALAGLGLCSLAVGQVVEAEDGLCQACLVQNARRESHTVTWQWPSACKSEPFTSGGHVVLDSGN